MEIKLQGHTAYKAQYHIVWITKYRRSLFGNQGLRNLMGMIIFDMVREMPGVEIKELNVQEDHVHMFVEVPPKYAVSGVVQKIKGGSSAKIRKKVAYLGKMRTKKDVLWSRGYFVSTVGIDEKVIERYVKFQGERDNGQMTLNL